MWEILRSTSREGNLARRIFSYATMALVAAFLVTILPSQVAHAADASWTSSKDAISYQSHTFAKSTADGTTPPSLAKGTTYYVYTTNPQDISGNGESDIIYFPNGNEATATTAHYVAYQFKSDATYGNKLSEKDISLTPQSQAPASTDVTWNGSNLVYNGNTFNSNNGNPWIADGKTPGLPSGAKYYQYATNPGFDGTGKGAVIYFGANDDPYKTTSAQYIEYTIDSNGNYTNPTNQKTVTVASQTAPTDPTKTPEATTCAVNGIGWLVCPVSNFIASGMDHIFDLIKGYLTVTTIANDTQGGIYKAWSLVRNISNLAFVIVFIILIYSQLTGFGVSNYGIKKLMPRLIVGAILVNVSYWICAAAVDLSNISGGALQELLVGIRQSLVAPNGHEMTSWQSMSSFILAGGGATAAAVIGIPIFIHSVGASVGAATILLLPILVGLLMAVLVALLVLAARQALIILFVIVSPLAFVAYLMPNTDKWFDKWRDAFGTLLVMFPIFALIFGGSQLAGFLIYTNADELNVALLGMFVQVAPLVITPLLVKFSGGIISRMTNMVNNPNKGIIDRTRKWSQEQSALWASRNMARRDPVRQHQIFRRVARGMDDYSRSREGYKKMYDAQNDARWANTRTYSDIDQGLRMAQDYKAQGDANSEARYVASKTISRELRNLDINVRNAKLRLDNAKLDTDIQWEEVHTQATAEQRLRARVSADTVSRLKAEHDAAYEEFKAGEMGAFPATAAVSQMMHQNQHDTQQVALQAMRNANAKRVQQNQLTNTLAQAIDQTATAAQRADANNLLRVAGGIEGGVGAQRALAQALTDQHKARQETLANANAILEHSNLSAEETLRIAQNISIKGITVTDDIKEAAAKRVASGGVVPHILELLKSVDMTAGGNEHLRNTIVEALKGNSIRPKFIGYGLMDQMTQGLPTHVSDTMIDEWVKKTLIEGKFSANELVSQDRDTLVRVSEALDRLPRTPDVVRALANLETQINNAESNAQMRDRAGERMSVLVEMKRKI